MHCRALGDGRAIFPTLKFGRGLQSLNKNIDEIIEFIDTHFGANYKHYLQLPKMVQITYLYFSANYKLPL